MNKYEESILHNLKNSGCKNVSKKDSWKLLSTGYVNPLMALNERENKIYDFISEIADNNKLGNCFYNLSKIKKMFIDWKNQKFIENVSIVVTEKEIEKAVKFWWLKNHLSFSRHFAIAINSSEKDNNIYLINVSTELGIYRYAKNMTDDDVKKMIENNAAIENENAATENAATENEKTAIEKISILMNSITSLSKELSADDKKELCNMLNKLSKSIGGVGDIVKHNKKVSA